LEPEVFDSESFSTINVTLYASANSVTSVMAPYACNSTHTNLTCSRNAVVLAFDGESIHDFPERFTFDHSLPVYFYRNDGEIILLASNWTNLVRGYSLRSMYNPDDFIEFYWSGMSTTGYSNRTCSNYVLEDSETEVDLANSFDSISFLANTRNAYCNELYPSLCLCIHDTI
jgi:hypothetical protein